MKKEKNITEQIEEYVKSQKASFRRHQRDLPFGEKMRIAFYLAESDKTIKNAVLLSKTNKKK